MIRRRTLVAAALTSPLFQSLAWSQSAFPNRPVKIIVPLQAGGSADISTRIIADSLQHRLKQPCIVENKPGGSFVIGMQAMRMAQPDGYTLISINSGMMAAQATMKRFDMLKSLSMITQYSKTPTLFAIPAKSRFKSFAELIEFARKNPGKLNFGSVGTGGLEHLWVTMFGQAVGASFTQIPFKGMPDALTALVQGELDFVPCVLSTALPFVNKGILKSLCVLSNERTTALPDVPSIKELGVSVAPMEFWSGLAAPQGTPAGVIEKLRQSIVDVLAEPELQQKMISRGVTVVNNVSSDGFASLLKDDQLWMNKVATEFDIRVD